MPRLHICLRPGSSRFAAARHPREPTLRSACGEVVGWRVSGPAALLVSLICAAAPRSARGSPDSGLPRPPSAALEGFATEEATRALTLAEALEFARRHQPTVAVTEARLRAAEEALAGARAGWRPTIGAIAQLSGGTANNSSAIVQPGGAVSLPRVGGTPQAIPPSLAPQPSTVVAVGLRQTVYDFGRIAAQTAVADAIVDLERRRGDEVLLGIALAVEEAYFAVLTAKAVRAAAEGARRRAEHHLAGARAGLSGGLRSAADVARAEAELAQLELGLVRAHGGVLAAQGALAATIGAEEPAIDAAGALADALAEPALGDAPGLAGHPLVRSMAAELRVQEAQTDALRRELRPTVFLGASFSGRAGGTPASNMTVPVGRGWLPVVPNWDVGVVFSAPLYEPLARARLKVARAETGIHRARLSVVERELRSRLRAARLQLEIAEQALRPLEQALAAAEKSARAAEARFSQGLGSGLEVSEAAARLVEAETALALGRFEVARGRALLRRELGGGR